MTCARCGRENRSEARFCDGCGDALAARCPACSSECRPGAQFCDKCGARLAANGAPHSPAAPRVDGALSTAARPASERQGDRAAQAAVARKVVTIVFADLIGSTALHERLDAEAARALMDDYYRALAAAVESHGGTVVKLLGDGVMAAFGVPRVTEDDAIRAVRAGVAMQQAFRTLAAAQRDLVGDLGLRVGINTGEVVVSADHADVIGDPVNVAARLQAEARDGDVVIGDSTRRLVGERVTLAPFGTFALKGRAEPVAAYRVVSLERPAVAPAIAFVGRDDEMRQLAAVYDAAVTGRAARLAVVLGSPGLGKSRLLAEFVSRLGDGATALTAQCNAAGGTTFAPLGEALRAHLGVEAGADSPSLRAAIDAATPSVEPAERARIAAGIGALLAGTPAAPEETFFVVRRLLAALALVRPVVLVIDDLHWAEPLLLDLTEHLVQWGAGMPLLVLAAARPELREARSSLASPGGYVSDVVTLGGLDAAAATRLAASVIGADALPAAVAGRVLATSEGNPLFLGELVRMLVQDGALRREGDRWTTSVALADLQMPPTIQALLAARIERLRPEDRLVIERAAVVGRHFSRAAVTHLLPAEAHTDLDARLESLRRSELIEPDTGWLLGEPLLRFHHVLIRDAAYRLLLRNTRAELHERFAEWLVGRAGESVEHDETIGWHLEQAYQHRRELGPLDAQGRALGERAARYLGAAGRRALARDDLLPAAGLLGRSLDLLDAADPGRPDVALDWCEALLAAGEVGTAARAIAELGRLMGDSDRLRAWHTCFVGQLAVLTDPKALRASEGAVAAAAETMTAAADAAGEAKAHATHALVLAQLGKIGACEAALDKALAAARRADDHRRANAVLAGAPLAALWGPSPVTRASGRCLDVVRVLRITQGAPAVEAVALRCQAVLETLRGRGEAARRMIAASRQLVEELGITQRVLEADLFAGLIELLEGDAAAAERWLRDAWDGLRAEGLGIDAAQAGALLARALLAQDLVAEAEAVSHESESLAGDSFKAAIAWRGVRAEVLAARGEPAAAIDLARAAVEIAAATDDLLDHADARASLAVALRAAGRTPEADAEQRRAVELWEAKGATLLVDRARRERDTQGQAASRDSNQVRDVRSPRADIGVDSRQQTAGMRTAAPPVARRRIRPNTLTALQARSDAAVAARDFDAVLALIAEEYREIDHTTGSEYGRAGLIASLQRLFRSHGATYQNEPLATLGERLGLVRRQVRASATGGGRFDVGEYENETICLWEVDERGLFSRQEVFAINRLGDAIVRLYERHAELLPDGPERARASAIARTIAVYSGPMNLERWAETWSPDIEYVDHRTIGLGSTRGSAAQLRVLASLLEAAPDARQRFDDVLALRPDAWLLHNTNSGTDHVTGGAYERVYLLLMVWSPDGLVTRIEQFDADREAQALARFDELASGDQPNRLVQRRVRANAASALVERFESAFARGDDDAHAATWSDDVVVHDHPTGATYGSDAHVRSLRRLARASGPRLWLEVLATLGDVLALCRSTFGGRGIVGGTFDVADWEREEALILELGEDGRCRQVEIFAAERLGNAIVRLYERYAELLPDGPARDRAVATARSVAAWNGPIDPERLRASIASSMESVDHRTLGTWSVRGAEAFLEQWGAQFEVSEKLDIRNHEVLALEPSAFLVRRTWLGTDRVSGGPFENLNLTLFVFGADGLLTEVEVFDPDRDVEALARFEALAAAPRPAPRAARRVRRNAATAVADALVAAVSARDLDAAAAVLASDMQTVHHPTGLVYDREGALASLRPLLAARDPRIEIEPIATLGDSLALCRQRLGASATSGTRFDVGGYEEFLVLVEVGPDGLNTRDEWFAPDRLGDAVVRLYERYAELLPDGPERDRAAATARSVATYQGPIDVERLAKVYAPDIEFIDHRTLGFGLRRGAPAFLQLIDTLVTAAPDATNRFDDVLGVRPDAMLTRVTNSGTDRGTGGTFERCLLRLAVFGADGLSIRTEQFDPDREAEALARFDALTAEAPPAPRAARRVRRDAATPVADALAAAAAAVAARDPDALAALCADNCQFVHHPTRLVHDRDGALASWRELFESADWQYQFEPMASLGDLLALDRDRIEIRGVSFGLDVGRAEILQFTLVEIGPDGKLRRAETFADDRLADAVVRLYERYAELQPEGPARARAAAIARAVGVWSGPIDPDRLATALAPSFECVDHRSLGTWSARGPEEWLRHWRWQDSLSASFALRDDDVLALEPDAYLLRMTYFGIERAGGGPFENVLLGLFVFGSDGLLTRVEGFEPDREAEALARFDQLTTAPAPARFANAATRANDAFIRCQHARDWEGVVALYGPEVRLIDRRAIVGVDLTGNDYLASLRVIFDMGFQGWRSELVATRGERLALFRYVIETEDGAAVELLNITEVDAGGRTSLVVAFDPDAVEAAYEELDARYEAGEAAAFAPGRAPEPSLLQPFHAHDWDAVAALLAPGFVLVDHRPLGWGELDGSAYVKSLRALGELSPDARLRCDHLRECERGILGVFLLHGTREGGAFEDPRVGVFERDASGHQVRQDHYTLDQLDAAMARFAELSGIGRRTTDEHDDHG